MTSGSAPADLAELDPHTNPITTVPRAAELLGISRSTAYAAVKNGTLPVIHLGRRIVVPTAALRRLLQLDPPAA